jgi:hypothetical protein
VEEQLAAGLGEGQVAEFVKNDEVEAREMVGEAALATGAGRGLELVDQVDDVEEAPPRAAADAGAGDADREVRLAGPGAADECEVALLQQEATAGEIADERLVDRRLCKSSISLASGSFATVIWYLIERACFSESSAARRSTTRCGSCCRLTAVATISS